MQFPNQSLMRLPLKAAGIIPKRCQFNNVMCFWWINKIMSQSCVCVGSSSGNGTSSLPEAFRPSDPAWTQQHHLPGKLRRTGFQQESEAGMGCREVPQTQVSKGHSPPAAAASVLPMPRKAAPWSLKEFSKGKSSPAKPGVLPLHSGAEQAISPVLTEEAELSKAVGTRAAALGAAQMILSLLSRYWVCEQQKNLLKWVLCKFEGSFTSLAVKLYLK